MSMAQTPKTLEHNQVKAETASVSGQVEGKVSMTCMLDLDT